MGYTQLKMVMPSLDNLPPVVLPEGCEIRMYQDGDEQMWADIMNCGLTDNWGVDKVVEQLTSRPQFAPERSFFAMINGQPAGTATAWLPSLDDPKTGMLHMVCVKPNARGKNLGYLLTLQVLHCFRELGCTYVYLTTDDYRIPAIKSYLRIGFVPEYADENHEDRWQRVMKQIDSGA